MYVWNYPNFANKKNKYEQKNLKEDTYIQSLKSLLGKEDVIFISFFLLLCVDKVIKKTCYFYHQRRI